MNGPNRSALGLMALSLAALPAGAQDPLWIHQFGTIKSESAQRAAADQRGGVTVVGTTTGKLGAPNAGGEDAWLARHDSSGNQLWIRQFGTPSYDYAHADAPDRAGGVYMAGSTGGSLGGPHAGGLYDAWLARFDGSGTQLWARQIGTGESDYAYATAADGGGGVYVAGTSGGSLGGPNAGGWDVWLAHYDSAGNQYWIHQLGTSTSEHAYAIGSDGAGGLYLGGKTYGDLGGPNAGQRDVWLARFEAWPPPGTYCTAKTTSTGCSPAIDCTGAPSASAPGGFTVTASQVEPNRPGILFYGTRSSSPFPFQGGYLCVEPPIRRTPVQDSGSGGSTPCTGILAVDLNAAGICSEIGAGYSGSMQGWFLDPPSPGGTGLTDALEWIVGP